MMKHESFSRCKDRDSKLEGHNNASSKSKIKPACETLQNKPFKGRIFYLDLPCNMKTQHLENDIKTLGGTVEKFFSKDIKYLVSNKPEARYAQRLLPDSPAPSPDSGVSSPHPGSRRESHRHRGSSQGVTDTVAVSRGKSLVERVVKEQERVQMNGILANAVEWGVKVLHVDDVISYVDKRKAKVIAVNAANPLVKGAGSIQHTETNAYQRQNAGRIRRPFVKVEDLSRHYRPIYVPLSNMPVCNLRSLPPCSPFLVEEHGKDDSKKKQKEQRSGGTRGKKERRREKKKGGYCECCEVKFDNLKAHMESEQHQAFSKSEEYRVVDRVSAGLTCDLMNISTHCRRVKCSTSTSLLCAETMLPVKEDLGSVNGDWKQESEGSLLWDSTTKHSLSEQNTGKPLLIRKRSRGQCEFSCNNLDSLFDQYDIPEKSQSKRGSFEWEFHLRSAMRKSEGASFLSREQNCDSNVLECRTDQHIWTNPDTHAAQELNERNQETITGDEYLRTNCCDIYAQSMPENQVENSALWPLANTEPEPDGDSPSNCLQRKVRNIRPRRRRQVPALHIESSKERESLCSLLPVQECESLPVSIPDLLELFQSSENMDEDFKGF